MHVPFMFFREAMVFRPGNKNLACSPLLPPPSTINTSWQIFGFSGSGERDGGFISICLNLSNSPIVGVVVVVEPPWRSVIKEQESYNTMFVHTCGYNFHLGTYRCVCTRI